MDARMEHLTTTEAAIAAGVSIPQINRMIDEKILPEDLYYTTPIRTFRSDACLLIAFYFETANWLTANARLETIATPGSAARPGTSGKTARWAITI